VANQDQDRAQQAERVEIVRPIMAQGHRGLPKFTSNTP
jgi:hypothetical protein